MLARRSLGSGVDDALGRLRLVLRAPLPGRPIALAARARARASRTASPLLLERVEAPQTAAARAARRRRVARAAHARDALRTNAELLREDPAGDHAAVLDDVVEQTEELSALVTDLIELARGDQPAEELQDVRLDALVGEALERARRHAPGIEFAPTWSPPPSTACRSGSGARSTTCSTTRPSSRRRAGGRGRRCAAAR